MSQAMEDESDDLSVTKLFPSIPDCTFIYPTDPFPTFAKKVPKQTKWLVERTWNPTVAEVKSFGEVPVKKPLPKYYYSTAQNVDSPRKKDRARQELSEGF